MSRSLSRLRLTDGLMKSLAAWIRNVNARRMLAEMPDYLLRDMGIRRDQIDSIGEIVVLDEATPAPAIARPSAEVIALTPARPTDNPQKPEKPIAA